MNDSSSLAITLARIASHPMWATYEEYPGDREAIVQAMEILRNLEVEWGLRAPDGFVFRVQAEPDWELDPEQVVRKRVHDAPDYWTAVSRKTTATEWEVV